MNRNRFLIIGVVGLGLAATGVLPVRADGPKRGKCKVTIAQLPTAVAKTLTQEADGGQVGKIDMKIGDHSAKYDADVVINKLPYEIKIAMDGTLLKKHLRDIELTMAELPAAAAATVKQEAGNGKVSDIEEHFTDGGRPFYKAKARIGEHVYKLKVLPNGTLLKMKLKEEDHGDHGHGDHGHGGGDHGDGHHGDHGDHDHGDGH